MKKHLLILSLAFIIYNCSAQNPHSGSLPIDSGLPEQSGNIPDPMGNVCNYVQEMPRFPGRDAAFIKYIHDNINYSKITTKAHGRVLVHFIIDENGNVKQASVVKATAMGGGCDEEALRVITSSPKWQPGKQNGHAVAVWLTVPVVFN